MSPELESPGTPALMLLTSTEVTSSFRRDLMSDSTAALKDVSDQELTVMRMVIRDLERICDSAVILFFPKSH